MKSSESVRILRVAKPSVRQRNEIRALEDLCNRTDGTTYSWDGGEADTFLAYDTDLIAYLQIFAPRSTEGEVTVQVRPDRRRIGVFDSLLAAAQEELRQRGIPSLLFVCDAQSSSGLRAVETLGATYEYSEFLMRLRDDSRTGVADASAIEVFVEPAVLADRGQLEKIRSEAFPGNESGAMVNEFLASRNRTLYRIRAEDATVGMIGVYDGGSSLYIHGFAVAEARRGQGIGTSALTALVRTVRQTYPDRTVELEVLTDNDNALGLYRKTGFDVVAEFRYYRANVI